MTRTACSGPSSDREPTHLAIRDARRTLTWADLERETTSSVTGSKPRSRARRPRRGRRAEQRRLPRRRDREPARRDDRHAGQDRLDGGRDGVSPHRRRLARRGHRIPVGREAAASSGLSSSTSTTTTPLARVPGRRAVALRPPRLGMSYTSGTTGRPKGVVRERRQPHRSPTRSRARRSPAHCASPRRHPPRGVPPVPRRAAHVRALGARRGRAADRDGPMGRRPRRRPPRDAARRRRSWCRRCSARCSRYPKTSAHGCRSRRSQTSFTVASRARSASSSDDRLARPGVHRVLRSERRRHDARHHRGVARPTRHGGPDPRRGGGEDPRR